jgi:hypothetical protein
MRSIGTLAHPLRFRELLKRSPVRTRMHIERILSTGGKLPPKSLQTLVDLLLGLQPDLAARLGRFSKRRAELISRMSAPARNNLAIQKETLATALTISGFGTEDLLSWSPETSETHSFLDGLPQAYVREDAAVIADLSTLPGFSAIREFSFAAKVFRNVADPGVRLTVIMANHLKLEEQTGADLIYYNETYNAFILVQYKTMTKGPQGPEFRWRKNDQLASEIRRMDKLLAQMRSVRVDKSADSFRLHSNPFFLKLCPRIVFNPDDKRLFPGMYLPLELWKALAKSPATAGPLGGRVINYANVARRLTNTEFVTLAANAWVGTTVPQSRLLEQVIRGVIQTGKTVTLAVKTAVQAV